MRSLVVVVGQSLCRRWGASQIPFTGGSGRVIDAGLALAGIAKDQIFITNVVHCHPRGDRESFPEEIEKCSRYLQRELEIVQPRVIVGLVRDAEAVLRPAYPHARELSWPFVSAPVRRPRATLSPDLLFPNHPSWVKWQLEWGLCGQRRPGR
ncbi:MAG: uracil-DNA glycosylase family protein [Mycobacterium sp.]